MAMIECCAESCSDESRNWALVHFGKAKLGDKRRTRRLVQLAAALTQLPQFARQNAPGDSARGVFS
jgi:hypothetical protein